MRTALGVSLFVSMHFVELDAVLCLFDSHKP